MSKGEVLGSSLIPQQPLVSHFTMMDALVTSAEDLTDPDSPGTVLRSTCLLPEGLQSSMPWSLSVQTADRKRAKTVLTDT